MCEIVCECGRVLECVNVYVGDTTEITQKRESERERERERERENAFLSKNVQSNQKAIECLILRTRIFCQLFDNGC